MVTFLEYIVLPSAVALMSIGAVVGAFYYAWKRQEQREKEEKERVEKQELRESRMAPITSKFRRQKEKESNRYE